jgi:hypothetical protein
MRCASTASEENMTPTQTAHRQYEESAQFPTDPLKAFIQARLARNEMPREIAYAVKDHLGIEIDRAHVIPYWKGEITLPTQTGHRQEDKESVQFPADAENESLFTRMPDGEAPETAKAPFSIEPDAAPICDGAPDADAPATQTGRRQDEEESLQIPADEVDAPAVTREARAAALAALGAHVKAKLGIEPDPAPATQTGRRQDKTKSVLTDEIKAFIVRGLARYETPTRVAASVQAQFGIAIDRRQVYAYDPAGARPPAQRWIDLHAATRAKFTRALSEIGIAQQVVRLRMLDRFANHAEEGNYTERAAKFLEQAAKECGGFYERFQRPKAAA